MRKKTFVTIEKGKTAIKCKNRTVYMALWAWCDANLDHNDWSCYAQHEVDSAKDYTILINHK